MSRILDSQINVTIKRVIKVLQIRKPNLTVNYAVKKKSVHWSQSTQQLWEPFVRNQLIY